MINRLVLGQRELRRRSALEAAAGGGERWKEEEEEQELRKKQTMHRMRWQVVWKLMA